MAVFRPPSAGEALTQMGWSARESPWLRKRQRLFYICAYLSGGANSAQVEAPASRAQTLVPTNWVRHFARPAALGAPELTDPKPKQRPSAEPRLRRLGTVQGQSLGPPALPPFRSQGCRAQRAGFAFPGLQPRPIRRENHLIRLRLSAPHGWRLLTAKPWPLRFRRGFPHGAPSARSFRLTV